MAELSGVMIGRATAVALVTALLAGVGGSVGWEKYGGHAADDEHHFERIGGELNELRVELTRVKLMGPNDKEFDTLANRVAYIDQNGSRAVQVLTTQANNIATQVLALSARVDTLCAKVDDMRLDLARLKEHISGKPAAWSPADAAHLLFGVL